MVNRTLRSKSVRMWHFLIYVVLNTAVCTLAVHFQFLDYISLLCITISFVYSLLCFDDSFVRKLAVSAAGVGCLWVSEAVQRVLLKAFTGEGMLGFGGSDVLASIICRCLSLCIFAALTIVVTNVFCKVTLRAFTLVLVINFLQLFAFSAVFSFMHGLIDVQLNGLFTVYALVFLLPALAFLYFTESVIFSRKDSRLTE